MKRMLSLLLSICLIAALIPVVSAGATSIYWEGTNAWSVPTSYTPCPVCGAALSYTFYTATVSGSQVHVTAQCPNGHAVWHVICNGCCWYNGGCTGKKASANWLKVQNPDDPMKATSNELVFTLTNCTGSDIYADRIYLNSAKQVSGYTEYYQAVKYISMTSSDYSVTSTGSVILNADFVGKLDQGTYVLTVTTVNGCVFYLIEKS